MTEDNLEANSLFTFTKHDKLGDYYYKFPERRPTFIPTRSALARDQSDTPVFDIEITSNTRGFHDQLPEDVSQKLLYELGMIYPTIAHIHLADNPEPGLPIYMTGSATGGTGQGCIFEWSQMQLCNEDETDPPPPSINIPTCNEWHHAGTGELMSFTQPEYGPLMVRLTVKDKRVSNDERYFSYTEKGPIEWPKYPPNDGRGKTLSINNYPNPFNPAAEIKLNVPETMHVSVTVYDLLGRKVSTVIDSELTPGRHSITFDGSFLATGTYFYVLQTDRGDRITRRLLLLK